MRPALDTERLSQQLLNGSRIETLLLRCRKQDTGFALSFIDRQDTLIPIPVQLGGPPALIRRLRHHAEMFEKHASPGFRVVDREVRISHGAILPEERLLEA